MPSRAIRLADYRQDDPPAGQPLHVLCEDDRGTYLLPFRCEWREGTWFSIPKATPIAAKVVGWRE